MKALVIALLATILMAGTVTATDATSGIGTSLIAWPKTNGSRTFPSMHLSGTWTATWTATGTCVASVAFLGIVGPPTDGVVKHAGSQSLGTALHVSGSRRVVKTFRFTGDPYRLTVRAPGCVWRMTIEG